jgi:hypothetical protein
MRWWRWWSRGKVRAPGHGVSRLALEPLEMRDLLTNGSLFVATQIVHSLEHYEDFVTAEYVRFLGRAPDAIGFQNWVGALVQGMAPETVEAGFVASPEYFLDHGNNNTDWLTGLYFDLLSRAPDSGGLNGWLNAMAGGTTPTQVALAFSFGQERQTIVITQDYLFFLQRAPEAGAISYWLGQLQQGDNRADVASKIVGSDEFFIRQGSDNTNFIIAAYQDVLQRTPTVSEISFWLQFM